MKRTQRSSSQSTNVRFVFVMVDGCLARIEHTAHSSCRRGWGDVHSGTSPSVAGGGRRVVARLLDAKMGAVVKGCTAAKKVEECGVESAVGERVVDVLSEAYRRGSWSDRHKVWRLWLCSQAKEGERARAMTFGCLGSRHRIRAVSRDSPPAHDAISRLAALHFCRSFTVHSSLHILYRARRQSHSPAIHRAATRPFHIFKPEAPSANHATSAL
jgi:hypothetical protein